MKVLKNLDKIKYKDQDCVLVQSDWEGNSCGFGLLWVVTENKQDPEEDRVIKGQVLGIMNVFDYSFYPITNVNDLVVGISSANQLAILAGMYLPKKTFWQKLKELFKS